MRYRFISFLFLFLFYACSKQSLISVTLGCTETTKYHEQFLKINSNEKREENLIAHVIEYLGLVLTE